MKRTPQQLKREDVEKILNKILRDSKVTLSPVFISTEENIENNFTITNFSFQKSDSDQIVEIRNQQGKGFIDAIFTGLSNYFNSEYPSLRKINLSNLKVNPSFSNSRKSLGTDAQATVILSIYVDSHGVSDFDHRSRSMIYSSFVSALNAYQFYINCEKAFDKIQDFLQDAKKRNRADIISQYTYDLTKLTEVNTYEKKERN